MIKVEKKKEKKEKKEKKVEKLETIYYGDEIVTTDKCILGEGKKGIVRVKKLDFFGIEFKDIVLDKELPKNEQLHNISSVLQKNEGYMLSRDEFKVINRKEYDDKTKERLVNILKEQGFNDFHELPKTIASIKDSIGYATSRIHEMTQDVRRTNKDKDLNILKLKELESKTLEFDYSQAENVFNKISGNKKVHKFSITDNYLVITTKNLTYSQNVSELPDFDLGRFKIFIPINDPNKSIKAVNISRHLSKGYYGHPCLENSLNICMGLDVSDVVHNYKNSGDYYGLVLVLINFFEQPDYGEPYRKDYEFYCAQDIDIHDEIKDEEDWLSRDILAKSSWDEEQFLKDLTNIKEQIDVDIDRCGNCDNYIDECSCE